jgi:hypothetical protein
LFLSLVCSWISVEKIILTLTNFFTCIYPFFFRFFRENSEIQDGCRGHITKKFKKCFFPSYISYLCYASEKKYDKTSEFFTAWVSGLVKFHWNNSFHAASNGREINTQGT